MASDHVHRTVDAVWRMESARLIAGLTRVVRDVGVAEELAQDALVAALEQWPDSGVPDNPGAWLMSTAKHKALDFLRRGEMLNRKHAEIARDLEEKQQQVLAIEALDDPVGDDVLRLIFIACHPILPTDARTALTLRLLGGLTTDEIARAYVVPEPTIAQRIVRAKKTLTDAAVPFELPSRQQLTERLTSVLDVIYLIFNEGYSATAGEQWTRPSLCEEALRLGRILAGLMPDEAEVHGLVALMELQASRLRARIAHDGTPILLLDQDRGRWDHLLIQRGLAALERSDRLSPQRGVYALQAAIAACHARAHVAAATDWIRIAALYAALVAIEPTPVVELNRAVAISMAFGPEAAMPIVDELATHPALKSYHLLPAVRADLLAKLDRRDEARSEFERAASLTRNDQERAVLLKRAREMSFRA